MLKQVTQKIEDLRRLIDRSASSSRFLLAVSGGMDSMCLLDLFYQILEQSEFAVAHCNFCLRGQESDDDQLLVEEYCNEYGIKLFTNEFDTEGYARENGISIEMAARDMRYAWFSQLCKENGFLAVVVAHNANDNAETLMLNLLRGTGLKGLHGMEAISSYKNSTDDTSLLILRPLLEFTRKQIEGYVLAHRVPYRHDSSNFSSDYKRNKIRNDVFPVFEKINPSYIRTLNRGIGYFGEAEQIVEDWCCAQLPSVIVSPEPSFCHPERSEGPLATLHISIPALLSTSHWRYLLYYILEPYGFNSQTLASVESLLESDRTISGKRFESPTHQLLISRDIMKVVCIQEFSSPVGEANDFIVVRGSGTYNIKGVRFVVKEIAWSKEMPLKQDDGTVIFDADKLRFPFVCRSWRQGDWLIPYGMRGKKKVSDLFADLKYDALAKKSAIMIVDTMTEGLAQKQHIAAVLGKRIDASYSVTPTTTSVVRIDITH